ncbi:hypothetical protein VTO73DRAFT_8471 [Trametes versicolor]
MRLSAGIALIVDGERLNVRLAQKCTPWIKVPRTCLVSRNQATSSRRLRWRNRFSYAMKPRIISLTVHLHGLCKNHDLPPKTIWKLGALSSQQQLCRAGTIRHAQS